MSKTIQVVAQEDDGVEISVQHKSVGGLDSEEANKLEQLTLEGVL